MEEQAVQLIITHNPFLEYFIWGAIGAVLYDFAFYFNRDLGLIKEKRLKLHEKPRYRGFFKLVFILCQTAYSAVMGGIIAMFVDNAPWTAFVVGFFSNVFVNYIVKKVLLNSNKDVFWYTVGRVLVAILLDPVKKFTAFLEASSKVLDNESKENDNRSNNK